MDLAIVRIIFIGTMAVAGYFLLPFGLKPWSACAAGVAIGLAIVLFESRLRLMSLKRLIGAVIGSVLGILGAFLFSHVIQDSLVPSNTQRFLELLVMMLMAYVGLIVGANKGDLLNLAALGGVFGGEKQGKKSYKILDTSVIIDGRIADIAETGFLDGTIVTPQFVLRELQLVADSADSLKRNRGRRGVEYQRTGQLAEADRSARRDHAGLHPEGRQGIQPGRGLSLRRDHGGGGQRQKDDRQDHRHLCDFSVADHGGKNDFWKVG
jgi:hypothetical protein